MAGVLTSREGGREIAIVNSGDDTGKGQALDCCGGHDVGGCGGTGPIRDGPKVGVDGENEADVWWGERWGVMRMVERGGR